ncbi:MAG: ParB/RepB/Spo0J family partition protein [Deltaproteobacteria bacterium]|nr:ParB/RepB/Spo0J family partition protein [Deltaproteobacteria bacterium]
MFMDRQRSQTSNKITQPAPSNTHRVPVSNESQANRTPQSTSPKSPLKSSEEGKIDPATSLSPADATTPEYLNIRISEIDFNEHTWRCNPDNRAMKQLAKSIHENGLLQVINVKREGDRYKTVFGNRRIAACKLIGLKTIRAEVKPAESITDAFPIIENIKRSDYEAIPFAIEIHKRLNSLRPELEVDDMIKLFNNVDRQSRQQNKIDATVKSIMEDTECSASTLRNHLCLLKLPANIRQAIEENKLKQSFGYVLANNIGHTDFDAISRKALKDKMSKSELEELFRSSCASTGDTNRRSAPTRRLLKQMQDLKVELKDKVEDLSHDEAEELLTELNELRSIIQAVSSPGSKIPHRDHDEVG